MLRTLVEDVVELACLAVFLTGVAVLSWSGAGPWLG